MIFFPPTAPPHGWRDIQTKEHYYAKNTFTRCHYVDGDIIYVRPKQQIDRAKAHAY